MDYQIIGPIKIKDGLFMGDEIAAQDLEFIVTNKVSHIINCAGRQIPNLWESIGITYLTFNWIESDSQMLFDERGENLNRIENFIENTKKMGESCLVHSEKGQSRACCVLSAYFMKAYNWTLYKTLEFLNSRRPDLEIRASFFHQLTELETKLMRINSNEMSNNWDEVGNKSSNKFDEERLIRNTFVNSKNGKVEDTSKIESNFTPNRAKGETPLGKPGPKKILWQDLVFNEKTKLVSMVIPPTNKEINKKNLRPSSQHANLEKNSINKSKKSTFKSILKGSNKLLHSFEDESSGNVGGQKNNIRNYNRNRSLTALEDNKLNNLSEKTKDFGSEQKISNITGNIIHVTVNNFVNTNQLPQYSKDIDSNIANFGKPEGIRPNYTTLSNSNDYSYKKNLIKKHPTPPRQYDRAEKQKKNSTTLNEEKNLTPNNLIKSVVNYQNNNKFNISNSNFNFNQQYVNNPIPKNAPFKVTYDNNFSKSSTPIEQEKPIKKNLLPLNPSNNPTNKPKSKNNPLLRSFSPGVKKIQSHNSNIRPDSEGGSNEIPKNKMRSSSYSSKPTNNTYNSNPLYNIQYLQRSTAGAGSGEFHQYRLQRSRERARVYQMEMEAKLEQKQKDFERQKVEKNELFDKKTEKKKLKRIKKKQTKIEKKEVKKIQNVAKEFNKFNNDGSFLELFLQKKIQYKENDENNKNNEKVEENNNKNEGKVNNNEKNGNNINNIKNENENNEENENIESNKNDDILENSKTIEKKD